MKKLTLLLHYSEKDDFLKRLQRLGVLHIECFPEVTSAELERLIEMKDRNERAHSFLKKLKKEQKLDFAEEIDKGPQLILDDFDDLTTLKNEMELTKKEKESEIETLSPWGDFEPENITKLEKAGMKVRFFQVDVKEYKSLDSSGDMPADMLGPYCHEIKTDKEKVYILFLDTGNPDYPAALKVKEKAKEIKLPAISLGEAHAGLNEVEKERMKIEASFDRMTAYIDILYDHGKELDDLISLENADLHMTPEKGGKILSVSGWLTADKEDKVANFLEGYSAWYEIRKPTPDEDVPVLLKNGVLTRFFEPVTKIFALPSNRELDPTPFFAPFFALFFGLCLADVGYGIIVVLAAIILLFKGPEKWRPVFKLGIILGLLTIVGGLSLNTFFGQSVFRMPGTEEGYFSSGQRLAPFGSYVEGGQMVFPAMTFALILGFAQVLTGMALQAFNRARRFGFTYAIQPLSYIAMIFGGLILAAHANVMELGELRSGPIPVGLILTGVPEIAGQISLASGGLLLFLFNNPQKRFLLRPLLGLWELYGFVTGLMGDVLSYLRLFALGLAGGLLGNAVNKIAFMMITDKAGVVDYSSIWMIGTILILIFGHTLNMALATLGGFVHSLRLTFVEFYKNMKFEGGGRPFEPLSLSSSHGEIKMDSD